MRSYLHIVTFIILNFTAVDCGAQDYVVYKSIGGTAHLTLKEHRNITTLKWRKDHNLIATVENKTPVIRNPEKYRIHASDNSLYIRNLMVSDSGYYKAQSGQWEEELITYNLIVQEAVSKPVINLANQSNISSVCHIMVKCSADDDTVMYICNPQQCTLTNASSTRVNITVKYTGTGVLDCTASNQVSTKKTSVHVMKSCPEQLVPTTTTTTPSTIICLVSIVLFAVLMICIVFISVPERKRKNQIRTPRNVSGIRPQNK